jgi:translocation and assembly module TamB
MGRRRLVVLLSALLMIALGAGAVGLFVAGTQGERGRDWIRQVVQAQLARTVRGKVHLGTISGSLLTDFRVDSIEIRGPDDSLFLATGPIRLEFDPRDILDGRFFIRAVAVERPQVWMRRTKEGKWAHDAIFARAEGVTSGGNRAIGSVIVLEQVSLNDGSVDVTLPRNKPDSLGRTTFTYKWRQLAGVAPRVRIAHPDSSGLLIELARLDVVESTPPFTFHDVRGTVRFLADSVFVDFPHFALPKSEGTAQGKVWWGGGRPAQYRVRVEGERVAMSDISWISPALPTEGRGRMSLDIRNARSTPEALEYVITGLDVNTHASRIRGRMTWVVGGPVLELRDVNLEGAPLDFKLVERFTQEPLPYPFAGQIHGRLRGPGGPMDRFVVQEMTMRWDDANVPGAQTRASGSGELDILDPANTIFRGFDVALETLDLRTMQALNPDFPKLNGTISGTARLDSSWRDMRFSQADVRHRDGDGGESQLTGRGRLTTGEVMRYELESTASLAMNTLVRSFPSIPLRGDWTGPLSVRGTMADLAVDTDLDGDGGGIDAQLRLDQEAPEYRVAGRARITAFDPRTALDERRAPNGELTARFTMDLDYDSLANLEGIGTVAVDRSILEGIRIFAGDARLRFTDGKVFVDTVGLETTALAVAGHGALGLHAGRSDSVQFSVRVDSLGGFRRWLTDAPTDSVTGQASVVGTLGGWVRDLALYAELEGDGIRTPAVSAERITGSAELTRLPNTPTGTITVAADSMRTAGLSMTRAFGRATFDGEGMTGIGFQMNGAGGAEARFATRLAQFGDTLDIHIDSASLVTELQEWRLTAPSLVRTGAAGFEVDSFVLRGSQQSLIEVRGQVPLEAAVGLTIRARGLPVEDIAQILQVAGTQKGRMDADIEVDGTRAAPRVVGRATLTDGLVRGVRLDTLVATATSASDALAFTAAVGTRSAPIIRAEGSLPFRFALDGRGSRMVEDGPVRATIRGDTIGLEIFEALTKRATGDPGTLGVDVFVGGTWRRPRLEGGIIVREGNLLIAPLGNTRWRNISADIGFDGDSIAIRRFVAFTSTEGRTGRAAASGWITVTERADPHFDISFRANGFNVYDEPSVATVDVSDSVRITGSYRRPAISGALTADRAIIRIPELATKDVIALEEFDGFGIRDDSRLVAEGYQPRRPTAFEENLVVRSLPIRMGRDVWLRSAEANINLGGTISVTRGRATRGADIGRPQLALTGDLQTVRGTYRLNLGPVQRTFEVETGEVQFFGDPDFTSAALDINALHTIGQYNKQGTNPDVRVRVHLGGSIGNPTALLSTPDSSRVKNADLMSYLVTGGPSFAIAGESSNYYTTTALTVLVSSLGSYLGGKAAGGVCDDVQFTTSGVSETNKGTGETAQTRAGNVLSGTRFNCARQLSENTYVRLDAGLCQVGQFVGSGKDLTVEGLTNSIGLKVDYILRPGLTISGGMEPPTSAVLCAQPESGRGFVATPLQLGLDLFRAWRF